MSGSSLNKYNFTENNQHINLSRFNKIDSCLKRSPAKRTPIYRPIEVIEIKDGDCPPKKVKYETNIIVDE